MSRCGTVRGYFDHRKAHELTCQLCRDAFRDYRNERRVLRGSCSRPGCGKLITARDLCSQHLSALLRHGDPDWMPPTKSELFWAQVALGSISVHCPELGPCWLWTGAVGSKGYGKFARPGGLAHIFAYRDMVGEIPAKYTIDHLCMVKLCVNPYHLDPVPRGVNARRYWDYYREMRQSA